MSDLHGQYNKYQRMLEQICFCDDDILYILGDICDRGEDSAEIYLDVIPRKNVFVIKGNHEMLAEEKLEYLLEKFPDEMSGTDMLELYYDRSMYNWFINGGDSTVTSLFRKTSEERRRIFDFIKSLPLFRTEELNGYRYVLVHGGPGDYREGMALEDIPDYDLAWSQPNFNGTYFDAQSTRLIVGHTPTFLITDQSKPASVYRGAGNVIAVDCGAAYPMYKGRLGCLCLDSNREFYV